MSKATLLQGANYSYARILMWQSVHSRHSVKIMGNKARMTQDSSSATTQCFIYTEMDERRRDNPVPEVPEIPELM